MKMNGAFVKGAQKAGLMAATAKHFPGDGIDTFSEMAKRGVFIVDRVVQEEIKGGIDMITNAWYIPGTAGAIASIKNNGNI